MASKAVGLGVVCLFFVPFAWSQQQVRSATQTTNQQAATAKPRVDFPNHVDAGNLYHRVYAVVLLVGSGKKGDPKRPQFAPLPSEMKHNHAGILGYQMQLTDDGKYALVEFVAADRASLQPILTGALVAFEKGTTPKETIEPALQKYIQSFSFNTHIPVRVP